MGRILHYTVEQGPHKPNHRREFWYNFGIMALLVAHNLAKYYGADDIFSELSMQLHAGERVALVGPNGCGKSTLLDILAGKLEPEAGSVTTMRDVRMGYLPQDPDFSSAATLWEAMEAVFAELESQQAELRRLEARMATPDEEERAQAMARYGRELEAFERAGGFTYQARIGQVLSGLGFQEFELHQPVSHLSGGEKTRALLARLLLEEPEVLLLDEPTNHLDLEGIEWLEDQLRVWRGAMIVVAHDRTFLDAIATRVLELNWGTVDSYPGNYSAYAAQRQERRARQAAEYEAQQRHIEEAEDYIRRYMAGQRSAQARGRLKRLERLERLERPAEAQQIHVDLQSTLRSGDLVLGLHDLSVGYEPKKPLLEVDEAEIRRGQRVALLGSNGSGKTTLLRTILHRLGPLSGRVRVGSGVRIGYFAQIQDQLVPGRSLLDTLLDAGMDSVAETRGFLARYGFRGDDVFKNVEVLSGGERARVAIAILSLAKANFLLLDEPTNHLDITSQEILQDVLLNFDGTILMVSHDRYLVREVATVVWAIAEGKLHVFQDGYEVYQDWHNLRRSSPRKAKQAQDEARLERDAERRAERDRERALARQQARLDELEAEIHSFELRLADLTTALNAAGRAQDISRVSKLGSEYRQVETKLNHLLEEWADVADRSPVS
jgi:ATP-binding cassette, subfamily F, member 3